MEYTSAIPQLVVTGITAGCIYAIVAVGFTIIYNTTGVINFAQGEFVMIGAMVTAVMASGHPMLLAIPTAVVAGCLVGAALAGLILIPLRRAAVLTLIIITIGASIMLQGIAQFLWGETAIPVPPFTVIAGDGFVEDRSFQVLGAVVQAQELWVVAVTALIVVGMTLFFRYTLIGQAMRACETNPAGARLVGISVRRMVVLSFVMAAGLGALAGLTVSPVFYAKVNMGTALGLKGFCAAVLGGLGNFGGGIVAGIVLGVVESLTGGLLWSDYKDAVAFVILLAILLIRPEGLLSRREGKK